MDETFRMLGREHEADLELEALKWERAAPFRVPRDVVDPHAVPLLTPSSPKGRRRRQRPPRSCPLRRDGDRRPTGKSWPSTPLSARSSALQFATDTGRAPTSSESPAAAEQIIETITS